MGIKIDTQISGTEERIQKQSYYGQLFLDSSIAVIQWKSISTNGSGRTGYLCKREKKWSSISISQHKDKYNIPIQSLLLLKCPPKLPFEIKLWVGSTPNFVRILSWNKKLDCSDDIFKLSRKAVLRSQFIALKKNNLNNFKKYHLCSFRAISRGNLTPGFIV